MNPNDMSAEEIAAFRNQPRVKLWSDSYDATVAVLNGMVSHEWPVAEDGHHEASPQCPCVPYYAGILGRMQFWYHDNPHAGVRNRNGALPIARWVEGREVLHTSWGFTREHARRRAAQWGAENRSQA
ncbi:MAG: hypothetical protein EOP84_24690 [Verrucomicrobiaceae bacterium]|nr:MAG: hypothetical protein EOP84_24690 [Verrucomicrobiaceae bacterium]